MLVQPRLHRNKWSAALALADNRASKVALLRERGHAELADHSEQRLREDVEDFLRRYPKDQPPRFRVALYEAARLDDPGVSV